MDISKIIALLVTKFPGVRRDVLENLAGSIALQTESEEEVNEIVGKLTAEKVTKFGQTFRSAIDREIQQSVQTNERKLKEKYDFIEKGGKPAEPPQDPNPNDPKGITLEDIEKIFAKKMEPIMQRFEETDRAKVAASRRERFNDLFKDKKVSKDMVELMTGQFELMNFKDDEAFNSYSDTVKQAIDKLEQQAIDADLSKGGPSFGKPDKDGVSSTVAAYLNAKNNPQNDLGGKSI